MNRYEVKKDIKNGNYGIYNTLAADFCYRNLGAIGENRYCFDVGINSFEGKRYEFERTLGDYLFDFSITNDKSNLILTINYINREDNEEINIFHYDTILNIINECLDYSLKKKNLKVVLPSVLFRDNNNRILDTTSDNFISYLKSVIIELEEEKDKIDIKDDNKEETKKVFRLLPFIKKNK